LQSGEFKVPIRSDLKKVVILGSGPIVIGQACEFDYSGTQACKALMQEGLEVILINSNPATIMTDPELATRVYIEPLEATFVEKILEKERPNAIIPTLGGQTALNLALELHYSGVLNRLQIEMLGANPDVIEAAEDRGRFCKVLDSVGAAYPRSRLVRTFEDGMVAGKEIGFPIILRPNYTLGGGGGGSAFSQEEYEGMLASALQESPTSEVLIEESIAGWKEFELEVMRDKDGTFVIVCSIENIDPCGVHTGDSITVAPQQTLSDRAYQQMRDEAARIINAIGLETGGANIQFAVNPVDGERKVIEMNPRVSRSSALASKATGFPIAKIAARLAVGYSLAELRNDITKTTPSCYEPALDYVVTKIPRFAFEKFPGSEDSLTTQMKSVGEVMAIGRTFKESFMKAFLSLEQNPEGIPEVEFSEELASRPNSQRMYHVFQAFREGASIESVYLWTHITPWFLEQIKSIVEEECFIRDGESLTEDVLWSAKRCGLSDARIAKLRGLKSEEVTQLRHDLGMRPTFDQVDTCAGEFYSETPYLYSTYWSLSRRSFPKGKTIAVLGSGPNRIGQGIEFDYSCVRGVGRLQKLGYRVAMINSNPETVSTDYDTSDILFFEPLTLESVIEIMHQVQPEGFVAQLGGQTPINLARGLVEAGFSLLGSSLEAIDRAEDRGLFIGICRDFDFIIPASGMADSLAVALQISEKVGFPLICRPSYVLGGRRMEVVETREDLISYFERYGQFFTEKAPCLIDHFLAGALEVDVDLVRGKDWTVIGGVVEHIEAAGVHSGDSMGVLPPQRLKADTCARIEELSCQLAERLGILGHLNLQLAVKEDQIYMLEANPRSSRSAPFVAKATAIPLVDLGISAMLGLDRTQVQAHVYNWKKTDIVSVKGVVFPFKKFPKADSLLGPEMKSTGESMGRGADYSEALLKALVSSRVALPSGGEVFFSLRDKDKELMLPMAKKLIEMGYSISATFGTASFFEQQSVPCLGLKKVHQGRPNCVDRIRSGDVAFVVNTASGRQSIQASFSIRRSCIDYFIPCLTESDAALAFLVALEKQRSGQFEVRPLPKI
jgi:carbamoyl-phosphate synthase large subunit